MREDTKAVTAHFLQKDQLVKGRLKFCREKTEGWCEEKRKNCREGKELLEKKRKSSGKNRRNYLEEREERTLYSVLGIIGSFPTHHQRILFTRHFHLLYPLFLHITVLATVINNSLESLGFALSGAAPGRIVVQIRCTRPLRLIRIV